jgi:replicative DNA helicase
MPYHNMPIYTKETGGMYLGGIHLLGGISNVGKSTYLRNCIIPSNLEYNEPLVIMLNEDGLKKWQREMLVWVANNIFKEDLQKYTVRDGKYSEECKALLLKCAKWIKDQEENNKIIIVPLEKWKTSYACKIINKYASLGVKHFIIDTFKADHDATSDNNWFIGQQNMVAINDIVKPESKNLSIVITFQMDKGSSKLRYFTQSNIGVFKNIIDVASTGSMVRAIFEDEYEGGKHELKVFRSEGKNGKTKIPVKLDKNKKYHIMFIVKSREGAANDYQIVYEVDLSRNIIKEIGTTVVSVDF